MQRIQEFLPGVEIDSKLREITKQNRLPPIRITSTDVAADLVAQLAAKKVNTEGVPMVASLSALRSQAEKSTKPKAMLSGEPGAFDFFFFRLDRRFTVVSSSRGGQGRARSRQEGKDCD